VWVMAGTWVALVGALCMVLTVAKRADAAAAGDCHAGGPHRRALPRHDPADLIGPPITTIVLDRREPGRALQISTSAPREPGPQRPPRSAELGHASPQHSYALHVRDTKVARLRWRAEAGQLAGWYLSRQRGDWRRLAVAQELDVGADLTARPGCQQTADLAACLSTALALDAAANLLQGPPAVPPRRLRSGCYEIHAAGLGSEIVAVAFREVVSVCAAHTTVLMGHFDDRALTLLTRRIAILGGHILALFHAPEPHAPGGAVDPAPPNSSRPG